MFSFIKQYLCQYVDLTFFVYSTGPGDFTCLLLHNTHFIQRHILAKESAKSTCWLHMSTFIEEYLLTTHAWLLCTVPVNLTWIRFAMLIIYLDARLPRGLKEAIIIKKWFVRLKCWPIDRLICFVASSPIQLFNYFIFLNLKQC